MPRHMNLRYALIHAAYWASYGLIWAFIAPLMAHYGFSTSVIGIVTAVATLLAVAVSPALAQFFSKSDKLLDRHGAAIQMLLAALLAALALIFDGSKFILAAAFLLLGTIQVTAPPFINTMGLTAANAGHGVVYGFCRGIGSVSYAVCVLIFGVLIERFAPPLLLPCYVVCTLLAFWAMITFRHSAERSSTPAQEKSMSAIALMRAYPRFTLTLLATALFYAAHHIYNIYLNNILERVGANESAMGLALAISAAVELPAMTFVSKYEKKLKCSTLFTIASATVLVRLAVYAFAPSVIWMYAVQCLQFFEFGFFLPATVYYVARKLPEQAQLQGQSLIFVASNGLGAAFGSLVGGILIDTSLGVYAALIFAAVCAVVALPLYASCDKLKDLT